MAFICQDSEANPANTKLAIDGSWTTAYLTAVFTTGAKLRLSSCLGDL